MVLGQVFLDKLPFWTPELRELKLLILMEIIELRFDGLKNYRNLVKVSFQHADGLKINDVEELLKCNPKLKEIQLWGCWYIDHRIFGVIANACIKCRNSELQLSRVQARERRVFRSTDKSEIAITVIFGG